MTVSVEFEEMKIEFWPERRGCVILEKTVFVEFKEMKIKFSLPNILKIDCLTLHS